MKKPVLYYSPESFKALVKRLKDAEHVPGSTARRMVETMKYDRWLLQQVEKDVETFREFIGEVFEIIYGQGALLQDYNQALSDIRALNEASQAAISDVATTTHIDIGGLEQPLIRYKGWILDEALENVKAMMKGVRTKPYPATSAIVTLHSAVTELRYLRAKFNESPETAIASQH